MGLTEQHPEYKAHVADWNQISDCEAGERTIKEKRSLYLPVTSGQLADGMHANQPGLAAYEAYLMRARFPDAVAESLDKMLGVMHSHPPKIQLPAQLEAMVDSATLDRESLASLLRKINRSQLLHARCGLMLDAPRPPLSPGRPNIPYIALYDARRAINWDDGEREETKPQTLNLVVLDECGPVRDMDLSWVDREQHRVLVLGDLAANETQAAYKFGVFVDEEPFDESKLMTASIAGKTIDEIPFVFVGATSIAPAVDKSPMLGLSNLSLAIYRGEADYRQTLFMQGQETLVIIGTSAVTDEAGKPTRVGAGAKLELVQGSDAKYVGVSAGGLSEMRQALDADYMRAEKKTSALTESQGIEAESGEALRERVAARTASLAQIVLTGAFGLQSILRMAAKWIGADPEQVKVSPNMRFARKALPAADLVSLMSARSLGAPLPLEDVHRMMFEGGMLESEDFDETLAKLQDEQERGIPGASSAPGSGDDPTGKGSPVEEEEEAGAGDEEDDGDEDDEGDGDADGEGAAADDDGVAPPRAAGR